MLLAVLSSCSAQSASEPVETTSPLAPAPDVATETSPSLPPEFLPQELDSALARGPAYVDSGEVASSNTGIYSLRLMGNLPTPCNQLRIQLTPPDAPNHIALSVYSVRDPAKVCATRLAPFDVQISLGGFAPGSYSVWVNETQVASFSV